MIVKILKAANSFSGVAYNENKNEKGTSELLSASNFQALEWAMGGELKKQDFIDYMEKVSSLNSRVVNKQFHAVISCKGTEFSTDQLHEIAKEYIKQMGYGENPNLIYFHNDTANNHVHIVSTRVKFDGSKVDDSFEKKRSQSIMNQIMNIDLGEKARMDIEAAKFYSVSSKAQFKLLLEKQGWRLDEKQGVIQMYKGGRKQAEFSSSDIKFDQKADDLQAKKLAAILYKYKVGLNHVELTALMKNKFGVDLVFHQAKGHDKPYGYTIIDNANKAVYKGSSIVNIEKIIAVPEDNHKLNFGKNLVYDLVKEDSKISFNKVQAELSKMGYSLSQTGEIKLNQNEISGVISDTVMEKLNYNQRVLNSNQFNVKSKEEAYLISRFFRVKYKDVELKSTSSSDDIQMYSDRVKSYMNNDSDPTTKLREQGIFIVTNNDHVFIVDEKNAKIFSENDLGINLKDDANVSKIEVSKTENFENQIDNDSNLKYEKNVFSLIASILDQNFGSYDQPNRRKKRNH